MLRKLPVSSVTTIPLEREKRFSIRNGNTEEKGRGEIEARPRLEMVRVGTS